MSINVNKLLLSLFIVIGSSSVTAAPIYTWQDEKGRTHFSDRPLTGDAQPLAEDYSIPPATDAGEAQSQNLMQQQIDYFYQRRDAEREARLEEQRIKQLAREQELQERRLRLDAEREGQPDTVIINSTPYYGFRRYRPHRPHHHRPHHHRRSSVRVHSPYAKQLLKNSHLQPHHPNPANRFPDYPLNFWKH